jgi:outer membrane protein OmpA-like peptidoglycan-associated protein
MPAPADTITFEQYDVIKRPVIFGILGETTLSDFQMSHLDEVVQIMKQFPLVRLSIVGHICDSKTKTEDARVGVERAKSVERYLESKGIDPGRMDVSPTSETDPSDPGDPIANYRNRRVVITVK